MIRFIFIIIIIFFISCQDKPNSISIIKDDKLNLNGSFVGYYNKHFFSYNLKIIKNQNHLTIYFNNKLGINLAYLRVSFDNKWQWYDYNNQKNILHHH